MSSLLCMWPWSRRGLCQILALCATQKISKKLQLRFPEASCRCLHMTASSSLGCCSLWMFCPHGQRECLFQFFRVPVRYRVSVAAFVPECILHNYIIDLATYVLHGGGIFNKLTVCKNLYFIASA